MPTIKLQELHIVHTEYNQITKECIICNQAV